MGKGLAYFGCMKDSVQPVRKNYKFLSLLMIRMGVINIYGRYK